MKKIILSLSLLLSIAVTGWSANRPTYEDPDVRELFKKEFAGAQEAKWSKEKNYDKVSFILGDHRVIAYYDKQGQLAGCIRSIFFDQLPLGVMRSIDKRFSNNSVLDVTELSNTEGTSYRVTLEKGNKKYSVKVSSEGVITEVKKRAL